MDILIKNMDKPKSCFSNYRHCQFEVISIDSKAHYCAITGDKVYRNKLKCNCPIVEVKPHGRLVDADIVKNLIVNAFVCLGKVTLNNILELIDGTPTEVEANNGRTD